MEQKLDTIIDLLVDIRNALSPPDPEPTPEGQQCACVAATGHPIGNCPFCRGNG